MSQTDVPSKRKDDQPVLKIQLLDTLIKYYEQECGGEGLDEALAKVGLSRDQLRDRENWTSANVVRALNHDLTARSGRPKLLYEVGLAAVSPTYLGSMYYALRALGTPQLVYRLLPTLNRSLSRITNWQIVKARRSHAVIRFHVEEGHKDDPSFCLNRQGSLAGIPRGFDLGEAELDHPVCIHEGGPYCEVSPPPSTGAGGS